MNTTASPPRTRNGPKGQGRSKKTPMIGVRLTHADEDVLEMLKAAKRAGFSLSSASIFIRATRLFLDPIYGHLKAVKRAKLRRQLIRGGAD